MRIRYESNVNPDIVFEEDYSEENLKILQERILQKQLENPDDPAYFNGTVQILEGSTDARID